MKVTIEFTRGSLVGQPPVVLEGRNVILVGRSHDCHIRPKEDKVSRSHCVLDIDNKGVTVRDFGSLNGTYVNGKNVGQREKGMSVEQGRQMRFASIPLRSGDRVGLSRDFEMRIRIEAGAARRPAAAANAKPGPGEIIAGYQEVKLLGKGGMGKVYLVREKSSGREMALKLMLPDCKVDEHSKQMFLREAYVAQQLQHSQVVRTYSSGYSPVGFYILMEYCKSGSVDRLMEMKGGTLPWRMAVEITLQVLDGLEYVHTTPVRVKLADGSVKTAHGIVHRDLKVQNIFLCDTSAHPKVKVADFGLAKAFETAGLTGSTLGVGGTLAFMPRQQVLNYRYCKPEVDVWAAAAMLYYMLTGRPPKPFQPGEQMIKTVLTKSAVPILKRNPNVPKKLAAVIDYALIDDPAIPFQSASVLKRKLRECL